MRTLYPQAEPFDHGLLDVGDGHHVRWERCGRPGGTPAVVLHGGPGSGCVPELRRYFDPEAYDLVLFDQRGCGRSTPHAGAPAVDLRANTTAHLLADVERLREHVGVERWLVFGRSWGSTLALAYAETHPDRVTAVVLAGVTTTGRADVEWATRGLRRLLPEDWERFAAGVPAGERDGDLAAAYHRLLVDPDPAVHTKAARRWCEWEDAVAKGPAGGRPDPRYRDPGFRLAFARLVTHYWAHAAWLEEGALLRDAARLDGIPGVLVHGRTDVSSPPAVAWDLARAWPGCELAFVARAGHATSAPAMVDALVTATDRFAGAR